MNGEPDEVEAYFADVEVNLEKLDGDVRNSFKFLCNEGRQGVVEFFIPSIRRQGLFGLCFYHSRFVQNS